MDSDTHFSMWLCQKVWDTDRRKRVSGMTVQSCFLHGLPYLHILVISMSFTFNSKQNTLKAHWIYLIIQKMVSFPLPQMRDNKKGSKTSQVLQKYIPQARGTGEGCCFPQAVVMYLACISQLTFWKYISEEMQYQESFEVRVYRYEENEFCRNLASVGTDSN